MLKKEGTCPFMWILTKNEQGLFRDPSSIQVLWKSVQYFLCDKPTNGYG